MKNLVGIIPAAGIAERLAPLPFSKELYPIGLYKLNGVENVLRPKPVILYIIEQMKNAGVKKILIVINEKKWDIGKYLKNGEEIGVEIAYVVQSVINGMPFAIDQVSGWVNENETVLFGMPDTIFNPKDALSKLIDKHLEFKSDLTLGLFPTNKPFKYGMVEYDSNFDFIHTVDKPKDSALNFMWGCACWEKTFSDMLQDHIKTENILLEEQILGNYFNLAKKNGLKVKTVPFFEGDYADIGTLEELVKIQSNITLKDY